MAVAQTDVMRPRGIDTAFPLGSPVVQRRDRDAGHVVNFVGREHLAVGLRRDCHVDSLWLEGSTAIGCPPTMRTCRNCKQLSTPVCAQLLAATPFRAADCMHETACVEMLLSHPAAPSGLGQCLADGAAHVSQRSSTPPTICPTSARPIVHPQDLPISPKSLYPLLFLIFITTRRSGKLRWHICTGCDTGGGCVGERDRNILWGSPSGLGS
jgi:hypothetical protein